MDDELEISKHEMAEKDFERDLYKNWVRGAKGLEYLQEGLQNFVEEKVQHCRNQSLHKITNCLPTGSAHQCNQCTSQNLLPEHAKKNRACNRNTCFEKYAHNCFGSKPNTRRKCPNGICSKLYDEIVLEHSSRDPLWKNTNQTTWCSDPLGWSYGKCFQTTLDPGISASETDAAGLLSILINNMTIQIDWLSCNDMSSKITCPFNRARDIRDAILHRSKLELDEPTLGYYLDTFITVLQDPKCLLNCNGSQQAVVKLLQLKRHQISISKKDETRLVQNREEALCELEEKTTEGLREIDARTATAHSKLEEKKVEGLRVIGDKTATAHAELEEKKAERLREIDYRTLTADSELEEKNAEGIREIYDRFALSSYKNTALFDLEQTTAKLKVMEEKQKTLYDIEEVKRGATRDLGGRSKAVFPKIDKAVKRSAHDVQVNKNVALSKIIDELQEAKETITAYTKDVKDKTKSALSGVEEARESVVEGESESETKERRISKFFRLVKKIRMSKLKAFQGRLIGHYRENALKDGEEDILKHMNRKCNLIILPKIVPAYKCGSPWQADRKLSDRKESKGVSSFVESIRLDSEENKRLIAVTGKPNEIEEAYIDILTTWINVVENGPGEDSVNEEYDAVLLLTKLHGAEYITDIDAFVCRSLARILGCTLEQIKNELSCCKKCLVLLDNTIRTDISTLQVKNPYFVIHATSTTETEKASTRFSLNRDRNVIITLKKDNCLTTDDGPEISKWIDKRLGYLSGRCNHSLCFVNMKAETKVNIEANHIDNLEIHNCDDHIYFIHGSRTLQLHGISVLDFSASSTVSRKLEHLSLYFEDRPGQKCCRSLSEKIIEDITTSVHKCSQLQIVELNNISIGRYKNISHSITISTIQQIKQDTSIRSPSSLCSALLGPTLEKYLFDKHDFDLEDSTFEKGIIMQSLCHQLVTSEEAVLEAYACELQHTERHEISIACFTTANDCDLPFSTYREFPVLQKQHNSVSSESIVAEADTNDLLYDFSACVEALNGVIGYNIDHLFRNHSNLEAVCGSRVRSTRSGIEKSAPCIVLYCRWKEMIPYGEEEFPTKLADKEGKNVFATDVREGFFVFGPNGTTLTGGALDWNKELAMGCSIGPTQGNYSGTIGPFLNVCGSDRTCFLTVRHLFQPLELDEIRLRGTKILQPADVDEVVGTQATRNSKTAEERACGEVLVSRFDSHVDAAVIEISKDRLPKRGNFVGITIGALHSAGFSQSNFPTFDDGKMMDATTLTTANHATVRVIKFGKKTGLTKGNLLLQNMAVKIKDEFKLSIDYNGQMRSHVMKRQLEIKSDPGKPFFLCGDSGSAVFLVDKDNTLHCIAMAIGFLTDQSCVATPIKTILEKLNGISPNGLRFELKNFDFEQMQP